jgi:hypothetical protein
VHDLAEVERVNHTEQRFDDLPNRRLTFDRQIKWRLLIQKRPRAMAHRV